MVRLVYFVPLWLIVMLLDLLLSLVNLAVVPYLLKRGAWTMRRSERYRNRMVLAWTPKWAWLFSNEEDGIDGCPMELEYGTWRIMYEKQQWWIDRTSKMKLEERIRAWCKRNSASNFRFVPGICLHIVPSKVRTLTISQTAWLCWQGIRGRIHFVVGKSEFEIGWKVKPTDAGGLAPDDYRLPGAGFGARRKTLA